MPENPIEKRNKAGPADVICEIENRLGQIRKTFEEISALENVSEPLSGLHTEKLADCERAQKKDLLIWKSYSQTGGIYDLLCSFETAVKKPAVNAFDFDEDEKCYFIFITLNKSLLSRLNEHVYHLQKQLSETSSYSNTDGEAIGEAKALLSLFNSVTHFRERIRNQEEWENRFTEYEKEYLHLSKGPAQNVKPKGHLTSHGENEEKLLEKVSLLLKTMRSELNNYKQGVEKYNSQRCYFASRYGTLHLYVAKYTSLYEAIDLLCSMTKESGELHGLARSPSMEDGVDAYMQLAEAFCKKAAEITKEYPL